VTGYVGAPPGCRPECIINSECASRLACINQKCQDPCLGSCGASAECHVVVHIPNCVCPSGFTGDPFTLCVVAQRKLRFLMSMVFMLWCNKLHHSKNYCRWNTHNWLVIFLHSIINLKSGHGNKDKCCFYIR
jgi:hypothetical protein